MTKPCLIFWGLFYVVVSFVTDVCLLLLCLFLVFSTKPRDWLGEHLRNDSFCAKLDLKMICNDFFANLIKSSF